MRRNEAEVGKRRRDREIDRLIAWIADRERDGCSGAAGQRLEIDPRRRERDAVVGSRRFTGLSPDILSSEQSGQLHRAGGLDRRIQRKRCIDGTWKVDGRD